MPHHHAHLHRRQHERREWWNSWDDMKKAAGDAFNPHQRNQEDRQEQQQQQQKPAQSTIYRTVIKTQTPEGVKPQLTTKAQPQQTQQAPQAQAQVQVQQTTSETPKQPAPTNIKAVASPTKEEKIAVDTSTGIPQSIVATKKPSTIASELAVDTAAPKPTQIQQAGPPIALTPTPSASSAPKSDGDSTAAKAGIALGVMGGIAVIFLIVFFAFKKRRQAMEKKRLDDDEKINGPFGDVHAIPGSGSSNTNKKLPRLSLRPVSQFLQGSSPHPDRRASRGANIAMVPSPGMNHAAGAGAWERSPTSSNSNPANPFGDNAERVHTPVRTNHDLPPVPQAASPNSPIGTAMAGVVAGVAAGAAAGAAAGGLTRKASIRKDAPKALDLTLPPTLSAVPPSPAVSEYSMRSVSPGDHAPAPLSAGAAAIAAAGGPPTSSVHRVQLDFAATLDDEMGLKAGQLIRLLHEYDDGWALCIRLDRSQQGVVPRTCLSVRPVKPRAPQGGPRGPPVNPQRGPGPNYPQGQRPMTPQGGPGFRPQSPAGRPNQHPRPQSPAGPYGGRPQSPAGRPMSPGPRSQSPGPRHQQGGPRSQSPSGMNRRASPPGPSPMNQEYRPAPSPASGPIERRPVPGQAY